MPDHSVHADILVIGSGPGGAVTATRCAEGGLSVLLVEEGAHLPLDSAPHFSNDEILQKYRNAGVSVAFGRGQLAWVEGCCVGGGSEINRGIYHRTPDYILEKWNETFGVDGLTPAELAPHFDACERIAQIEYLPGSAPILSTMLQRGADRMGWQAIEAPRLYRYDKMRQTGSKQSMSATFIPRFLDAGGRLLPRTRVRRLVRSAGKWRAIAQTSPPDAAAIEIEIVADQVFVACGAVQTPALLRRSGITHNIGNTLRFHPMLKVAAEFPTAVNLPGDADPVHQIKEFEPSFGIGCSISTRPMLALALANSGERRALVEQAWQRMGIYYVQTSGGCATVRNIPMFQDPLVRITYSEADRRVFAEGFKRLAEGLLAAGAVRIHPGIASHPTLTSMDQVVSLPSRYDARDGSLTSVHVFCSCPMGERQDVTATNSFGRVHGTDGLYIADASILCTPTAVNPQGTVMAIAHRNVTEALARRFH